MFDQAPNVSGHSSWKQTISASMRPRIDRMALCLSLPTGPVADDNYNYPLTTTRITHC